tara:strand:+ start:4921 stop:5325 length:405 start_codon:yes stop_codon:yes gene_type:complete
MAFTKFRAIFPTIIFVLVCVLVSMIVLNFFQINMNDNNGFKVLNRVLTVEGMKNGTKNNKGEAILKEEMSGKKHKKEGMCSSGKHKEGMCGLMEGMCTLEGMKNKDKDKDEDEDEEEEEEELATIGAFASNLMD